MSHYIHADDGSWCDLPGPVHRDVVVRRGDVNCYGHARHLALAPEGRATPAARLAALANLVRHWGAEADRLDDEREGDYDVDAEATAEALRTAAQAVLSILHPDVDLESSAASQTYIESGCWPTRIVLRRTA